MSKDLFLEHIDVSRETLERLELYAALLEKWQKKINLVSKKTIPDLWTRHFLDSAQLFQHLPSPDSKILDLGSGAGFPGLILSILGARNVSLVDSDSRKCAFMREAARQTESPVTVFELRIESLPPTTYDVVTSRACADLNVLLELSSTYRHPESICLFLKGRHYKEELTTAKKSWKLRETLIPSLSDDEGTILRLEGISHASSGRTERK